MVCPTRTTPACPAATTSRATSPASSPPWSLSSRRWSPSGEGSSDDLPGRALCPRAGLALVHPVLLLLRRSFRRRLRAGDPASLLRRLAGRARVEDRLLR